MSAWRKARSLGELGELTAQWLEGTRRHPDHPEPDDETGRIRDALIRLNRSGGAVTLTSQPGQSDEQGSQRAAVEMLATPQRAEELAEQARAAGLHAHVATPHRWGRPGAGLDVTTRHDEVVTDMGGQLSRGALSRMLGDPPAALLRDARQITVIDPQWGRAAALWNTVAPPPKPTEPTPAPTTSVPAAGGSTMSGIDEIRAAIGQVNETLRGVAAGQAQHGMDLDQASGMLHQVASSSSREEPQHALAALAQVRDDLDRIQGQLASSMEALDSYAASL